MFIVKNINLKGIMAFTGHHIPWLLTWSAVVTCLFEFTGWKWMSIPWLPLSVIGIAVAFYVGFKNSQSYDRLWEARKIWGAIVNSSRSWGAAVRGFVGNQFKEEPATQEEIAGIQYRLIHRHVAWLYQLRSQLLIPTPWEHINQNKHVAMMTESRIKRFGIGMLEEDPTDKSLAKYLSKKELAELKSKKNMATQIIERQSMDLKNLREQGLIDDFRHMSLQKLLDEFYVEQGKCERIKKFPFPRQYGGMSKVFVGIFIFLLPFGMVAEFEKIISWGSWLSIPFTALVAWVFLVMELIGDYSENPFEGLGNDIPMLSLCRTIEIDLLEMMGEEEIPEPIEAINGVLL